jgi:ribosomal protein S18 acetylase RimI-like enzyme
MSFIKQFAEQELRRLKASSPARLITLVATDESGKCVGTLDLKLDADDLDNRDLLRAESEDKVERCGYLTNVVVAAEKRGQGIGGQLVDFAARLAGKELGIDTLYCHADAQNQPASALYASCGFLRCSAVSEVAAGTLVGQKELLKLQVVK